MSDTVRITLNGRPAMTLQQLAVATGRPATAGDTAIRPALRRAGVEPDGWLDGRTPLYFTARAMKILKPKEPTMTYADLDTATRAALHEQAGHNCDALTACVHFNGDRPSPFVNLVDRAELARVEAEHGYVHEERR